MEPGNLSANSVLVDKVAAMAKEKGAAQCNVVAALVPKEEVHGNRYAGNDTKRGTYLVLVLMLFSWRTPVEDLATRRSFSSWISTTTNDLSRSKFSVVLPSFSTVEGKE